MVDAQDLIKHLQAREQELEATVEILEANIAARDQVIGQLRAQVQAGGLTPRQALAARLVKARINSGAPVDMVACVEAAFIAADEILNTPDPAPEPDAPHGGADLRSSADV